MPLTGAGYLAFIVYGYRAAGDGVLFIGWTLLAAIATIALFLWITAVNLVYLLLQIAMAARTSVAQGCGARGRPLQPRRVPRA